MHAACASGRRAQRCLLQEESLLSSAMLLQLISCGRRGADNVLALLMHQLTTRRPRSWMVASCSAQTLIYLLQGPPRFRFCLRIFALPHQTNSTQIHIASLSRLCKHVAQLCACSSAWGWQRERLPVPGPLRCRRDELLFLIGLAPDG